MSERLNRASLAALVLTAAYFALGIMWVRARHELGVPANDIYAYFYPNALYAWRSLRAGAGLLWNPYQDCGQPFFAISTTGLLYPVNLVFAVLDREPALIATLILNLSIAAAGMFLLCREIGLSLSAALCGALAFQLSGWAVQLAAWSPMHIGPYAWLPVALWLTERLVHVPSFRRGLLLGVALTVQLLPGFPQIAFFTYQLIGLRIGWELMTRRAGRPLLLLAAAAAGLALPFFLGAIQLWPSLELMRQSVRSGPLEPRQFGPGFSWELLRANVRAYATYHGNFIAVVMAVWALVVLRWRASQGQVAFYLAVAMLYFVLSLGPGTPLFDWYSRLPLGSMFRGSARLLWVTSFAMAMLVGLGAQAILCPAPGESPWFRRAGAGVPVALTLAFHLLAPGGLRWSDGLLAAALLVLAAMRPPRLASLSRLALPVLIFANGAVFGAPPLQGLRLGDLYGGAAPAFEFVRERLTSQDRILTMGRYGAFPDFALIPKTASMFRIASIFDYEPQAPRSYAELFTFMRTGRPMRRLNDWYWVFDKLMPDTLQRPLFDLTGTRYVVVDRELDRTEQVLKTGVRMLTESRYVRVYENRQALPRARYVPRIEVTSEDRILPRLARGRADPRRLALVSQAPRSGFLGSQGDASGRARIALDASERVVIRVRATAPGFLFLADQYFPGWTARVNGQEREILRANHAFRLVEVPAGESEVVFAYQPLSVRLGTAVSLATVVALVAVWCTGRRTREMA